MGELVQWGLIGILVLHSILDHHNMVELDERVRELEKLAGVDDDG